jgi:hypothetical protein
MLLSVVLVIVAVAIIGGVAVVAIGRGGEMASFDASARPLDAGTGPAAYPAQPCPPAAQRGYPAWTVDAPGYAGTLVQPGTPASSGWPAREVLSSGRPEDHGGPEEQNDTATEA